jgi:cell division protein FtsI (penicillin-binding protein 3)
VGIAFAVLLGRAVWLQILHTDFYQAQGEKRFVHKEALPASRGRILDRNGLVLASSVALPSVQIDGKNFAADTAQRKALAKAGGPAAKELDERMPHWAWAAWCLRRQIEEAQWQQIKALGMKGVQDVREFKRRYPEGESAAHVVGFTDIDGKGIDGIERSFQPQLLGQTGQRTVVRDRLGRVVEGVGDRAEPVNGNESRCPSIPRCSSSPTSACATRCASTRPWPAAWWCWTSRLARCWRWPTSPATTLRSAPTSPARSCATAR